MSDNYTERLSEYLDGSLDANERAAMDAHLRACAECHATLEELRAVVTQAQTLGAIEPQRDLWPAIAEHIAAERDVVLPARRTGAARVSMSVPQLAAAAVALMLLSGGAVWMTGRQEPASVARVTQPQGAVLPVSRDAAPAAADKTIAELERMLLDSEAQLDPATIAVLERNLIIIDQALAEARAALARDPANAYLTRHYENTMRKKLDLLQQAGSIGRGST